MDALQQWGIGLILALQQGSPALDGLMRFLSLLGQEDFFLVVIPLLYWCLSISLGMRMFGALLCSDFVNGLAKWAFHAPRPYWIDPRVKALASETSYGIPSGHAQNATATWGFMAAALSKRLPQRRAWYGLAALILILAISLSRVYLGVHFPTDVLGGWLLGALVLAGYLWAEPRVIAWLAQRPLGFQIIAAFVTSLLMLALMLIVRAALSTVTDPVAWEAQAAAAYPLPAGQPAIDSRNMDGLVTDAASVFGAGAGLALMRRYAPFDVAGPWLTRLLRLALGLAVFLVLRLSLKAIFPAEPLALGLVFRYIRYTIMLLWVVWLAPWVFIKIGLATTTNSHSTIPRLDAPQTNASGG